MALAAPPGFVEFAPPSPGVFRGYLNIVNGPNDGFLYFTQNDNDGIGQLDSRTGTFREFIIPTQFGRPSGITVGPDGKIWFTETGAGQIGRLDPATGEVTEFPLTAATFGALQSQPRPITTGQDNNLWFVQIGPQLANVQFQSFIGRMTPAGVHTEFLVPSLSAFSLDEGITVGPDGKIWFTESNVRKVGRLDPATGVVDEFDMGSARAPLSITRGPDGHLWAGTNAGLARITTDGIVTHFDLPQAQGNDEVFGITSGADGHIWFTLGFALGLGRIDPAAPEQVSLFPIGSFQLDRFPYGITRGPDGNIWYTDLNANRIGQASLLSILPAPGTFVTAQSIDVLVVNHAAGRVATGGQMRLTTLAPVPTLPRDVTAEFLGCVVGGAGFGTLTAGGQTFRCGSVPLSLALLGAGRHRLEVDLTLDDGSQLHQAVVWNVLASTDPVVPPNPGPVVGPPELIVAPPAGQLAATQLVDFVVAVAGGGRTLKGGRAFLDGSDVTSALGACLIPGNLIDGGVTFRCPRLPAEVLTPGPHLLEVEVDLDDSSTLRGRVEYVGILNTEP